MAVVGRLWTSLLSRHTGKWHARSHHPPIPAQVHALQRISGKVGGVLGPVCVWDSAALREMRVYVKLPALQKGRKPLGNTTPAKKTRVQTNLDPRTHLFSLGWLPGTLLAFALAVSLPRFPASRGPGAGGAATLCIRRQEAATAGWMIAAVSSRAPSAGRAGEPLGRADASFPSTVWPLCLLGLTTGVPPRAGKWRWRCGHLQLHGTLTESRDPERSRKQPSSPLNQACGRSPCLATNSRTLWVPHQPAAKYQLSEWFPVPRSRVTGITGRG